MYIFLFNENSKLNSKYFVSNNSKFHTKLLNFTNIYLRIYISFSELNLRCTINNFK